MPGRWRSGAWQAFRLGAALVASACAEAPYVPPEGVPQLFRAADTAPALYETALDGCVEVHHIWKAQIRAVHRTAGGSIGERVRMLVDSAYTPYADMWDGYVSNGFGRWARREFDLAGDPRSAIPTQIDLLEEIAGPTARVAEMTGVRGCAEWFLLYGPGWTNLGGLSGGLMIIDFYGISAADGVAEIRRDLPHEVGHLIRRTARREAGRGPRRFTVLSSIIEEGFATYFGDLYRGDENTPAEALVYSDAEWQWALAHEAELWEIAARELDETDRDVIDRYRTGRRLVEEGPGRVGYFLGYRIIQAYVARHGDGSFQSLLRLSAPEILEASGYAP